MRPTWFCTMLDKDAPAVAYIEGPTEYSINATIRHQELRHQDLGSREDGVLFTLSFSSVSGEITSTVLACTPSRRPSRNRPIKFPLQIGNPN